MEYIKQLETKDLILGKAKIEDTQSIFENYWSSDKTAKYMLWVPQRTFEEAKARVERTINFQKDHLAFFVYEKATGKAIGQAAMLEVEPGIFEDGGIGIGEKFVGNGYGKQILKAFIEYLFSELDAKKIICSCHTDNIPSAKMQMSCGLKYSHSSMVTREKDGLIYKSDNYTITKEDWLKSKNNGLY